MAYPVPISIPKSIASPTDGDIKHVIFCGENETVYRFEYKKLEKTLLFEYLRRKLTDWPSICERLMTVTFKNPMWQAENSKDVLKRSIFCDGKYFRFLGHSESQLRENTCYLMDASEEEIHDHLAQFGDFARITDVGLRAKTIGLLFATFDTLLELGEDDVKITPDVKSDRGFMYPQFSSMLRDQLAGVNYPEPSAVLVRYHGFESVLVRKEEDTNVRHLVEFHKSMQNFAIPEAMRQAMSFICIVDRSKPNTNGYLDAQLIMLLVARGVPVEYLTKLQKDYLNLLKRVPGDSACARYFLRLIGHNDPTLNEELTARYRRREIEMINYVTEDGNSEAQRCPVTRTRILVPQARMVYGVCDPYNELKNGECYFKPTLQHEESECFAAENKVVVACRPCYHPGDIRVLKLTHEKQKYEHLVDCLVLPGNGLHSHAFVCAGDDLGGSKFFVSWDPHLIPKENIEPCSYLPTTGEWMSDIWAKCWSYTRWLLNGFPRKSKKEIREEMIVEYFCSFKDDLPNRIDKTYTKFAKAFGPSSDQCKQLSRMFYQAANFAIDRTVLLEMLVKLEQELSQFEFELSRPASSADESPTEMSGLLEDVEEGEMRSVARRNNDGFFSRLSCWSYGAPSFPLGDEVWKDFDERTARFVEEVQQEH